MGMNNSTTYTVECARPRRFNTLEEAMAYANAYFRARGIIVNVRENKPKTK